VILLFVTISAFCGNETPRLNIESAVFGENKVDITKRVQDQVRYGTYADILNYRVLVGATPWKNSNDKSIRITYTENGVRKNVKLLPGKRIRLGRLEPRETVGTPEWFSYYLDFSGGGLQHGMLVIGMRCPWCDGKIDYDISKDSERAFCMNKACGKTLEASALPTAGIDYFDGMKFEYALVNGKKYYFLPYMRYARTRTVPRVGGNLAMRSRKTKNAKLAGLALKILCLYGDYYKKYICELEGGKILRRGHPLDCEHARMRNFGDVYQVYSFCMNYLDIESSGLKITPEERAYFRSFMENMISEVSLPYIRQTGGLGNPMPGVYGDCLTVGKVFPEAKIVDHMMGGRILSGNELVHETVLGSVGFFQYLTNITYPDGLAKERTVSYNNMIVRGGYSYLYNRLATYETPKDYDAVAAGYVRLNRENVINAPAVQKFLTYYCNVVTPDGAQIPIGDSYGGGMKPRVLVKDPLPKSTLFAGWGMGALRLGEKENASAAILNWGSTRDRHSQVDMLSLLFWADELLMLNTTEYPANQNDIAPKKWWNAAAAAHNTAIIDGENHVRRYPASMTLWGEAPHMTAVQAQGNLHKDPKKSMRRTAVLVDSRSGKIPYLVDLVELNGGKKYDLFFQAQSFRRDDYETLSVRTPELKASGAVNLQKRLNSKPGAALEYVKNILEAPLVKNGELEWFFPSGEAKKRRPEREKNFFAPSGPSKHLRAVFIPVPGETLLTGDAPGERYNPPDIRDSKIRTVRKVVRHAESDKTVRFISVFESRKHSGAYTLKHAESLPCANGTAVRTVHDSNVDLILIANEKSAGPMRVTFEGKPVVFDGRLAVLSQKDGKTEYSTVGGSFLSYGGKKVNLSPDVQGKLLSHDLKTTTVFLNEVPAVIDVSVRPEQLKVGQMMVVASKTGVTIPYRITKIEPGEKNTARLTLDRPARIGRGFVNEITPDGKTITLTGKVEGTKTGLRVLIGNKDRTVTKTGLDRHYWTPFITLDAPVSASLKKGFPMVFNEIGKGDRFIVYPSSFGVLE